MKKIKCAVIGCGRIAVKHFEAIVKHQESLELVAVCDTNLKLAQQVSRENNCEAFTSLSLLLKESDVELIILCTPGGLHASQTVLCAEAGKHVMTEKPNGYSMERWIKDGESM